MVTESSLNPSTAVARVLVAALVSNGVIDVVLAPGSRNAPLSLELAAAERRGELKLHVRVDERTAGFLALGLAKRSALPVPVVVTSGTAAAELLPALVEAAYSAVSEMAITADRPVELRGVGANQTIDQVGLFGGVIRWSADVPAIEIVEQRSLRTVQSIISRAAAVARDPFDAGPVHLNVAFRDPLVPNDTDDQLVAAVIANPTVHVDDRLTAAMVLPIDQALASDGPLPKRGLIIVGDPIDDECREAAADLADACGWPLLTEPSGLPEIDSDALIAHAPLLLADEVFAASHVPELVITVGRVGLSRSTMRLIASADRHVVVDPRPATRWADPLRTSSRVLSAVPEPPEEFEHDSQWLAEWVRAAEVADDAISSLLDHEGQVSAPAAARLLMAQADAAGVVLVAASWPVRHVEAYALPQARMPLVVGNRGASGIDGLMSTAIGISLAHQREGGSTGYALIGDLAFLYDTNALLLGSDEVQPNLVIVVIDNDGGGIFGSLEQGQPRFANDFERVFGTPHGRDVAAVARAYGIPARTVASNLEFIAAVDDCVQLGGIQVIVANTGSRRDEAALVEQLQVAVSAAVAAMPQTP